MISIDFSGQTVVVIGGTSGINKGVAELFAECGAKVAVASRNQEKIDNTVQGLRNRGAEAFGFCADVRDYDALEQGFASVAEVFGPIEVLVSGAAGNFPALVKDMSPNGFKSVMDIDLLGTYHVMRAAYPYLQKPGASVINISAPQAQQAMLGQAHVCAAKAGVDMVTRTLALEWGEEGVRINSLIPGPIDGTEGMARLAPTNDMREACRQSVPLRRLGTPRDIAHACLFLSSPLSSYISGAIIPVDGGWLQGGFGSLSASLAQKLNAENEG